VAEYEKTKQKRVCLGGGLPGAPVAGAEAAGGGEVCLVTSCIAGRRAIVHGEKKWFCSRNIVATSCSAVVLWFGVGMALVAPPEAQRR
jgi:hypothetical protein